MKLTGAQALIKSLEMEGTEVMFGLPGGCILPAYDPIIDSPIRHILVRHEQGAGHMAEGYAHVTGRPGVAMVTRGPAASRSQCRVRPCEEQRRWMACARWCRRYVPGLSWRARPAGTVAPPVPSNRAACWGRNAGVAWPTRKFPGPASGKP